MHTPTKPKINKKKATETSRSGQIRPRSGRGGARRRQQPRRGGRPGGSRGRQRRGWRRGGGVGEEREAAASGRKARRWRRGGPARRRRWGVTGPSRRSPAAGRRGRDAAVRMDLPPVGEAGTRRRVGGEAAVERGGPAAGEAEEGGGMRTIRVSGARAVYIPSYPWTAGWNQIRAGSFLQICPARISNRCVRCAIGCGRHKVRSSEFSRSAVRERERAS
jgi:hypothetical protein